MNCHKCISVCPVKICNNGSGSTIELINDLCIICGECLKYCTHGARIFIDDFAAAMEALDNNEKIIAFAAPSVVSNFPDKYLNLNGWLKSKGVEVIFDVSFGAELAVKSYLEYIKSNKPKLVITQPCPPIVNYIEIYRPELLPYLAPVQSPMLHVMKMVQEYYPQYKNFKYLVISPCVAKGHEFEETGIGDFNVTMAGLIDYLAENNINLNDFPKVDYANDPAERAVLFSNPGGLLETVEREVPNIKYRARKIESPKDIYKYLDDLSISIESETIPLLIDCLNCSLGCNGGTGTHNWNKSPDELEYYTYKRSEEMKLIYSSEGLEKDNLTDINKIIDKYWKTGLYKRDYNNLVELRNNFNSNPPEDKLNEIYISLKKNEPSDFQNCSSCGYGSCEGMAVAIYNGLNKKENCHSYTNKLIFEYNTTLENIVEKRSKDLKEKNKELTILYESQKETNKQLSTLERDKNYFISLMSHELNTPLNAIMGFAQLLKSSVSDDEHVEFCEIIIESGKRLKRFSDLSMLITSLRTEKYSLKKYIQDISFIIDDAVGNYSQKAIEKDIAIIKEIKSESLELFIDSELIQKVVEILLDNAVKFSPKNSEIHVRYLNRKSKFILEVEDNGIGFSPKTLERVFNIFTSDEIMNHSEGVGLGLAVAKIIMDTHQSDIQVYNKVEGGAIVKLIFNKNSSVLEEK